MIGFLAAATVHVWVTVSLLGDGKSPATAFHPDLTPGATMTLAARSDAEALVLVVLPAKDYAVFKKKCHKVHGFVKHHDDKHQLGDPIDYSPWLKVVLKKEAKRLGAGADFDPTKYDAGD